MNEANLATPITVNGLEYYITADGTQSGMSLSALSRMCGVANHTIARTIERVKTAGQITQYNSLKPLQGKDIWLDSPALNNARVLKSEYCACVISYFATEYVKPTVEAREVLTKFAAVGLHVFILNETGFKLPSAMTQSDAFEQMVTMARSFHTLEVSTEQMPGLKAINHSLATPVKRPRHPEMLTLAEYLLTKDIILGRSEMSKLSNIVAATYKAHRQHEPISKQVAYISPTGKKACGITNIYAAEDFPIIDSTLKHLNILSPLT
jgi:hypothetical protein